MTVSLPQIAILGAGSMGGAILSGLLSPEVRADGIVVTNRTEAKAAGLRESTAGHEGVVSLALESDPDATATALRGARIVLLGVKPAMVPDLLAGIRSLLEPDALVVSLAAGVTIATMEALVPQVVELLTWIVFEYAGQMFGALIGDEPATADERSAFEAAVAGQPRPPS